MKTFGIVLMCLGGLLVASGVRLIFTEYDVSQSADLQKAVGATCIPLIIFAVGLLLYRKGNRGPDDDVY